MLGDRHCTSANMNAEKVSSPEWLLPLLIRRLWSILWSRFATLQKLKWSFLKSGVLSHVPFESKPEGSTAKYPTCICTCTSALNSVSMKWAFLQRLTALLYYRYSCDSLKKRMHSLQTNTFLLISFKLSCEVHCMITGFIVPKQNYPCEQHPRVMHVCTVALDNSSSGQISVAIMVP